MRLYELVAATKTHTPDQAAMKHGVSLKFINNQLNMGIRIEHEHTSDTSEATKIALDHLMEIPDYYTRLKKMETDAGVNESFDSEPADVVLLSRTSGLRRYSFDIDDNIYIILMRGPDDGPSNGTTWEIEYGIKEPSDNKSGYIVKASPSQTGNASKVFSTLINFLKDFIYEQGVSRLVFTGSKSNGLSSLYDRMIPHLATRLGYTYERIQTIYSYQYVIDIPDETITEATPWLRQTPTMIRQATGLKGQVIVEMPADKFLSMTTSTPDERDYISKNAHSLRRYNNM